MTVVLSHPTYENKSNRTTTYIEDINNNNEELGSDVRCIIYFMQVQCFTSPSDIFLNNKFKVLNVHTLTHTRTHARIHTID